MKISKGTRTFLLLSALLVILNGLAACSDATDEATPLPTRAAVVLPSEAPTTPTHTPTVTNTRIPPSPTPTVTPRPTLTPTPRPTLLPEEFLDSYWAIQWAGFGSIWNAFGQTASRWDMDPGDGIFGLNRRLIVRMRQSGEILWSQLLEVEEPNSLRVHHDFLSTSDGGLLVPALIEPPYGVDYSSNYKSVLLKINADGILQWQRYYVKKPLEASEDGGFLILDRNDDFIKLNNEGDVDWTAALHIPHPGEYDPNFGPPPGFYNPIFGRELGDGGILVGGFTWAFAATRPPDPSRGRGDAPMTLWFARISSSHEVLWTRFFKFRGFVGAVHTHDGGIAVAGSYVVGDLDTAWLMKMLPNGEIEYWRRYPDIHFVQAVKGTPEGGFLLLGTGPWVVEPNGYYFPEHRLLKLNAQGYVEWAVAFEGEPYPEAVTTFQDGSIVVLMQGGLFARLKPNGHLPDCDAFTQKDIQARVINVSPPIDESYTVGELTASPAPDLTELPLSERPQLEIVPLQWEVTELCRTMP